MTSWRMIRPGHHYDRVSGLHVVSGSDHGAALWAVWTRDPADDGRPLTGPLDSIHDAKRRGESLALLPASERA